MSQLGRPDICGSWGTATFFKEAFPTYCNRKPGHGGPCSYTNSRGNEYELQSVQANEVER